MSDGVSLFGLNPSKTLAALTLSALLAACGQLPSPKVAEEVAAKTLASTVLKALTEVEQNNPYSTGQDATCTQQPGSVTVSSGDNSKKVNAAESITGVTCTSTKTTFTVKITTKSGVNITETGQKDPQLVSARTAAQEALKALEDAEQKNPQSSGTDATCTFKSPILTITSGSQTRTVNVPTSVSYIACSNTTTGFTVTATTQNGQTLVQKLKKSQEGFAALVARDILAAMAAVEAQNPTSTGADATCAYANGQVQVASGAEERTVNAPAPVAGVTCTSTTTQFTTTITTQDGKQIIREQTKDPELNIQDFKLAQETAKKVLNAMAAVEAQNPASNGHDATCSFDTNLWVVNVTSGLEVQTVQIPRSVTSVACTTSATQFSTVTTTARGNFATVSAAKDPDLQERDAEAARTAAQAVLKAMAAVEEANVLSNGMDASCAYTASNGAVTVTSGIETRMVYAPLPVTGLTCTSTSTSFSVSVATARQGPFPYTYTAFKDPAINENDRAFAENIVKNVLNAMASAEATNLNSNGQDATCTHDFASKKVTVVSGSETRQVLAPAPITSITCVSNKDQFTVTASTVRNQNISWSMAKDPSLNENDLSFARAVATSIVNTLATVEAASVTSNGADATCTYWNQKVNIESGQVSQGVPAPAPVNGVTCTSTQTQFSSTVTTSRGNSITVVLEKDPAINENDRKLAEGVANRLLDAMAAVQQANPQSNGKDAVCVYSSQQITVSSGQETLLVTIPKQVTNVLCSPGEKDFVVIVGTYRHSSGITVTRQK